MPQIQHSMSSAIPLRDGRLVNDRYGVGGSVRSMANPQTQMMSDGRFVNNVQGVGGHIMNMRQPAVIQHVVPQQFQQLPQQFTQQVKEVGTKSKKALEEQAKQTLQRKGGSVGKVAVDILGSKEGRKVAGSVAKKGLKILGSLLKR